MRTILFFPTVSHYRAAECMALNFVTHLQGGLSLGAIGHVESDISTVRKIREVIEQDMLGVSFAFAAPHRMQFRALEVRYSDEISTYRTG